jgi:two-component system phosphate regulon sensor histidine kinase PhoR
LATEAICRPDVVDDQDRVLHFNAMIENENRRMRSQTEKILQMAALEERDIELNLSDFDVHEVIQSAVDATALQVQNLKGKLTCRLEATRSTIKADKIHLTNIIHNLLDNAMKYSKDVPNISVRTFDSDDGLGIRIEDHGIGLKPDDRKHVFEKYYRVPTGNRHDVKGFGLGLSYVKMMVEAHGGTIGLYSQYGEGTQVELIFPIEIGEEAGNNGTA